MQNFEIASVLREIAVYLEMDDVQFKPRAYEKAARSIEATEESIEETYRKGGINALMEIPGVGQSIAEKIEELVTTGRLNYYEELKRKVPVDLRSLYGIEGLGPKKIKALWQKLRIRNIEDLEAACLAHRVRNLPGFQEKTEQNILKGIEFVKKNKGRQVLGFILPFIRSIETRLRSLPYVRQAEVAGSVRRMKETIGDADFLVVSDDPKKVMAYFTSMPEVDEVLSRGDTRSSIKLKIGMNADIRVLPEESFGAGLQYFTGSKYHNIELRKIAQDKGWKLSEYGLFEKDRQIAGKSEEEVYEKLGLEWIPPELRENTGEVEAALHHKLPRLIEYNDLKGDLQVHSKWTDGSNSIREMAQEARRIGLQYIVISDHSKSLGMTGGLDEGMLLKQAKEIDKTNQEIEGLKILKGVELNILKDGRVDISDKVLERLDVVGAAIHSYFTLSAEETTNRLLKTMENPNVDIIYHPTARQIQKREQVPVDIEAILETARDTGTILDIDSFPDRLDLKDEYIRKAVSIGAKLCITSDSHGKAHLRYLELGIAQARRGWATSNDIVNTKSLQELRKLLKSAAIPA